MQTETRTIHLITGQRKTKEKLVTRDNGRPKLNIRISAPNIKTAIFEIEGLTSLVIHRFSQKTKAAIIAKMELGSTAAKNIKKEKLNPKAEYEAARYRLKDGSDGFNASAVRNALISACRLVGIKMTHAKLCLFVEADGRDRDEPAINLVRIYGKPVMQQDIGRLPNGSPCPIFRPAFHEWKAKLRILFDADQFIIEDVANLLSRAGRQVGLCEGRPDSKNSAGMGWGT